MNESFVCECGENTFLWLGDYVKCKKCLNRYAYDLHYETLWLCRFNKKTCVYNNNWEHSKLTYRDIIGE